MPEQEARDDERWTLRSGIADEISGVQVGTGYESTTIGISAALEAADLLMAAGYRKHPEPEITDEMVERAITAAWGDETWRDWNEQAVSEEMDSMRRALEAALRLPVGEGEQAE